MIRLLEKYTDIETLKLLTLFSDSFEINEITNHAGFPVKVKN